MHAIKVGLLIYDLVTSPETMRAVVRIAICVRSAKYATHMSQ